MEISEDFFGDLHREEKFLHFLTLLANILNCEQSWNIDVLRFQVQKIEPYFKEFKDCVELTLVNDNSVLLSNTEVKKILLADNELKDKLEVFVKVLLKFLSSKTEDFNRYTYQYILHFADQTSTILKTCEKNNIVTASVKSHVTKFLSELICILETADALNFTKKSPVYQFVLKVVGFFKKIKFANNFLITEISKKLQTFYNFLEKSKKNFDISYYEIVLLHLRILKEILQYNLQELILKLPAKPSKLEDKAVHNITENLTKMIHKVPDYVALVIHDCLNLLL